ncbi:hypothetical protein pb186bvf_009645 [Paramecium bursaria]
MIIKKIQTSQIIQNKGFNPIIVSDVLGQKVFYYFLFVKQIKNLINSEQQIYMYIKKIIQQDNASPQSHDNHK